MSDYLVQQIRIQVPLVVWDCGLPAHRHKTESAARRCLQNPTRDRPRPTPREIFKKKLAVCRQILRGKSRAEVAAEFGLSITSVAGYLRWMVRCARFDGPAALDTCLARLAAGYGHYGDVELLCWAKDWLKYLEELERNRLQLGYYYARVPRSLLK